MKNAKSRFRKYGNVKTTVDGIEFDSKAEAKRWQELKLLERAGEIIGLERQVTYRLEVDGVLICKYMADFDYVDAKTKELKSEDVKGFTTPVFRLKAKLFRATQGRDILVVKKKG